MREWQKTILQVRLRRQQVVEFTQKQDVLQLVERLRRGESHVDSLAREGTLDLHGLFTQVPPMDSQQAASNSLPLCV